MASLYLSIIIPLDLYIATSGNIPATKLPNFLKSIFVVEGRF